MMLSSWTVSYNWCQKGNRKCFEQRSESYFHYMVKCSFIYWLMDVTEDTCLNLVLKNVDTFLAWIIISNHKQLGVRFKGELKAYIHISLYESNTLQG